MAGPKLSAAHGVSAGGARLLPCVMAARAEKRVKRLHYVIASVAICCYLGCNMLITVQEGMYCVLAKWSQDGLSRRFVGLVGMDMRGASWTSQLGQGHLTTVVWSTITVNKLNEPRLGSS